MQTFVEIVTMVGRFLVGYWPIMFIVLLFGIFKRRKGFGTGLRVSIKSLIFAWVFFAILRAVFFFLKMETFPLILEPLNSKVFLVVGLLILPVVFAIVLEERHKRYSNNSIADMQALTPSEFEELVANTYRDQGHQVDVVGSRGDHGIDLIIHTRKGETWLVQCKKYRGKVGEPVVRDFYGTLRASEATEGAIITTGQITDQARLWAEGKPLHLYDGHQFLKIIQSTKRYNRLPVEVPKKELPGIGKPSTVFKQAFQPAVEAVYAMPSAHTGLPETDPEDETTLPDKSPFMNILDAPDCPVCGVPMVKEEKNKLLFFKKPRYICSNAPACSETMPAD